ncbi:hypothetical protein Pve01_80930 [Planomonospora venezuelensis]|nr:hypothetical protein Pve01_80930 [Planomonospora venezuelensis]
MRCAVLGQNGWVVALEDQIQAILGSNIFRWAQSRLPITKTMDDVRFSDFFSVTEDEVYEYVLANGFDGQAVAEGDAASGADDPLCAVPLEDGRWTVYYTERGVRSDEVKVPSHSAARREVVRRLMRSARIDLNHRYRLAHPEESLPPPSEMD